MKPYKIAFLTVVLLTFLSGIISAQEVEKSKKTEFIGKKHYYIHTVKKGETIYGIAKAYSVDLSQIYDANPEVKSNIQPGVIIKVPQVKNPESVASIKHIVEKGETLYRVATNYNLKVADVIAINPGLTESIKPGQQILIPLPVKKQAETEATTIHIVQKGETLFSIANQNGTTVDELKKLNPAVTENLQLGQMLKVPVVKKIEKVPAKDSVIVVDCGKTGIQQTYNIAVMIPFYLNNLYEIDTADTRTPSSTYKSLTFIQFYEGIKLALDSLEKTGASVKVYVYDVAEDTTNTSSILKKSEFSNMNLIIGPLFSTNFTIVAKWANQHKVNIINPFTTKCDLISDNPYTFKLVPSHNSEARQIHSFIETNYPESNVLLVYNDKELSFADSLKVLFDAHESEKNLKIKVFKINYSSEGYAGVSSKLSDSKINIVITLIDGEAFVSTFLRNLNEKTHTNKILLFGKKTWEDYNNLEIEYLLNLNMHVYSNSFIDFSNPRTQEMVLNFRNTYKTEPDYYAFQGYDIIMYFVNAMKSYGQYFQGCLNLYNPTLLCNHFRFDKSKHWGFENTTGIIYRYENYKAINALLNPIKDIKLVVKKTPY